MDSVNTAETRPAPVRPNPILRSFCRLPRVRCRTSMLLARILVTVLFALCFGRLASAQPSDTQHMDLRPGVSLVLSGGGPQGFSHIGVLDVLDSAHVPINLIVGTSIGAAIGGLYAAGYTPDELSDFAERTDWTDVLDLNGDTHREERRLSQKDAVQGVLSLRFTGFFEPVIPQALSSGQRLTMLLNSMIIKAPGGVAQDFLHDLRVPFIAIATDIVKGERRLLTHGDLTEAIRASVTLPFRFDPLSTDTSILMDGGLLANIPTDVAHDAGAPIIVVSNATSKLRTRDELQTPWDVADQVISLMMERQYAASLKLADVVIRSDATVTANDYSSIASSIEAGRVAARNALPDILRKLHALQPSTNETALPHDTLLPVLQAIVVHSTVTLPDSVLDRARNLRGLPLLAGPGEQAIENSIVEWYRNSGYSLAHIDSVTSDGSTGTLTLFMDEGHIESIKIQGNGFIHPDLILRELPFSRQDVFRAADAERALENLSATGLFDYATIRVYYDSAVSDPHTASVLVTVQPRASNVIRLGVLADNDFGAQFSTELANENLLGTGLMVSLRGGLGPASRYASLTTDAPRLFRSSATLLAEIYTGYKDIPKYDLVTVIHEGKLVSTQQDIVRESRDLGIRLRAGGQLGRLGALLAEVRRESQQWYSLRDSDKSRDRLQVTTLRGQVALDSRDDRDYPHTGSYASGFIESGIRAFGGEAAFTKLYGEVEQAIPLSRLHTLTPALSAGYGDLLPRLEQFSLGGMESFYGLQQYELRGGQIATASLTYQIAIPHVLFFPTFVSIRYDLGAIWPQPEAIKFETLLHGVGAQVGLRTPFGLARFALGEAFRFTTDQNHPIALTNPAFYFSIGANL
jgi:predicted acylesterase/phospholipase RssA